MENHSKPKRYVIVVSEGTHRLLRIEAAKRGTTIIDLAESFIADSLKRKPLANSKLER